MSNKNAPNKWLGARNALIKNVRRQNFMPSEGNPACVPVNGKSVALPAYIPFIGNDYFKHHPRILCYAINQSISWHARWTKDWIERWAKDYSIAIDRLNIAAENGEAIPLKPYAEGFIPLIAAMVLLWKASFNRNKLPKSIDSVIAATNFVKFSSLESASSAIIPKSWWDECGRRYVRQELLTLKPDIVIAFGQRTYREMMRVMESIPEKHFSPEILQCRFPAHISSVRTRPLTSRESTAWNKYILPLTEHLFQPGPESYQKWRMLKFPGYFLDAAKALRIHFPEE